MNIKIVCDSSSNVFAMEGLNYTTVPMKILAGGKEFVDNAQLDLQGMVDFLKEHKGKSGSSCPNVQDWLDAFEGEEYIFGITITIRHAHDNEYQVLLPDEDEIIRIVDRGNGTYSTHHSDWLS